jgi:uncharacterized protein involved in exopolysaccharide biosynthesis
MSDASPTLDQDANEKRLDPALIARALWAGKFTILICTMVAFVLTVLYLHTLSYSYSATLTLVPTQGQSQSAGSQFGSLASLAGINLPGANAASPFTIYGDALATRDVAETVMRRDPSLMPRLYSYAWNPQTRSWQEPFSLRHTLAGYIKPLLGMPASEWQAPSGADLQEYISQNVKVVQDAKRPVLALTYFNPDPKFAAYFLNLVHESTDSVLRRMSLDRASKYSRYLEEKLQTVQGTDLRQVLVQSLSQQESMLMMGSANTAFAAQPLGVPVVSLAPVQPRGFFILIAGTLAGFALGAFLSYQGISATTLWRSLADRLGGRR